MEKLHHPLWIVQWVNALAGPLVAAALRPLGISFEAGTDVIPDFVVMALLILVAMAALCLVIRSRLSVENPGKLQILLETLISGLNGMLDENIGPKGRRYLPLVGTVGTFILVGNLMGYPWLMALTSNINVTLGCGDRLSTTVQGSGTGYRLREALPRAGALIGSFIYFPSRSSATFRACRHSRPVERQYLRGSWSS
jgi:F0F1-type ATP synthase membrane subunit a